MFSALLSIMVLHFLAQLTPGPDILLIARISATQNFKTAVFAIAGITLGIVFWITLTLTGFHFALSRWVWFQPVIMLFGAVFLARMGYLMFKSFRHYLKHKNSPTGGYFSVPNENHSNIKYFFQGLATNLANPKAVVYFASVFSLAVNAPTLADKQWILAIVITIETFLTFILIAKILSHEKLKQYYQSFLPYIDGIAGVLFIGFAIWLVIQATNML